MSLNVYMVYVLNTRLDGYYIYCFNAVTIVPDECGKGGFATNENKFLTCNGAEISIGFGMNVLDI